MKKSRVEIIETPLGQRLEIQWYFATAAEIENVVSRGGCVRIKTGEETFIVQFDPRLNHGRYTILQQGANDTELREVKSLSEAFFGVVEFFHDLKV